MKSNVFNNREHVKARKEDEIEVIFSVGEKSSIFFEILTSAYLTDKCEAFNCLLPIDATHRVNLWIGGKQLWQGNGGSLLTFGNHLAKCLASEEFFKWPRGYEIFENIYPPEFYWSSTFLRRNIDTKESTTVIENTILDYLADHELGYNFKSNERDTFWILPKLNLKYCRVVYAGIFTEIETSILKEVLNSLMSFIEELEAYREMQLNRLEGEERKTYPFLKELMRRQFPKE